MSDPVSTSSLDERHHQRPPLYRNAAVVKWLAQITLLALVVGALIFLVRVAGDTLRASNIVVDFDFLSEDPGIKLGEGIDTDPDTGGRALWVGMVNTLRTAAAGIVVATILGTAVGLARLSNNWITRKLGSIYVETVRNIPVLVQILLIAAVLTTLSPIALDQGPINGWLHLSNKGLSVPRIYASDGFYQWLVLMVIATVAAIFVYRWRSTIHDRTGAETHPWLWFVGLVVGSGVIAWFINPITAPLGSVFDGVADVFDAIDPIVIQLLLCALAIFIAYRWIRRFVDKRRSGGGVMHLIDDDWFRMIFVAIGALVTVVVLLIVWPGLSSWVINSLRDLFVVLADKFGDGRAAQPIDIARPDIVQPGNFPNYGVSGLNFSVGFAAVYFGVVIYTASFIAETVRGGILAVPKGQIEAANALGLRRSTTLRRVILPQALRVILPPLGNQYLNLTKNTSLAIAVGYSDIVQVGQTIYNQTGRTLPVVAIWMLFYLACSLTISVVVNWFNVRLAIVER